MLLLSGFEPYFILTISKTNTGRWSLVEITGLDDSPGWLWGVGGTRPSRGDTVVQQAFQKAFLLAAAASGSVYRDGKQDAPDLLQGSQGADLSSGRSLEYLTSCGKLPLPPPPPPPGVISVATEERKHKCRVDQGS